MTRTVLSAQFNELDEIARWHERSGRNRDGQELFKLLRDDELAASAERPMLVQGVVPAGALAVLVGKPGSMKTFAALDLALSVANGVPWCGRRVQQGRVLYVLGEGRGGIARRVSAWNAEHGIDRSARARFIDHAIQLHDAAQITKLLATISPNGADLALVVFDTLARCIVGADENSARDMGEVIAAADRIRRCTGATVLLLHHTDRAGERERGSTALPGAADMMARATGRGDQLILDCLKMKDADQFPRLNFRRKSVSLHQGGTSCILVPVGDLSNSPASAAELSLPDQDAVEVLRRFGAEGASQTKWGAAFRKEHRNISEPGFRKIAHRLQDRGRVQRGSGSRGKYHVPELTSSEVKSHGE